MTETQKTPFTAKKRLKCVKTGPQEAFKSQDPASTEAPGHDLRAPTATLTPEAIKTARSWVVEASLEDIVAACGQPVELVRIATSNRMAGSTVHVRVVELIRQGRYWRYPGDLLCRQIRRADRATTSLIPAMPGEIATCEYCLRKPPRIERRRKERALTAAHLFPQEAVEAARMAPTGQERERTHA